MDLAGARALGHSRAHTRVGTHFARVPFFDSITISTLQTGMTIAKSRLTNFLLFS